MSQAKSVADSADGDPGDPYRVMVVDDSAVIRGLLARALEADPMVKVVASVGNGEVAVKALERHHVDVIILDIEMPVMDGLTARSEERRVGKECVSTCRSRWSPYH